LFFWLSHFSLVFSTFLYFSPSLYFPPFFILLFSSFSILRNVKLPKENLLNCLIFGAQFPKNAFLNENLIIEDFTGEYTSSFALRKGEKEEGEEERREEEKRRKEKNEDPSSLLLSSPPFSVEMEERKEKEKRKEKKEKEKEKRDHFVVFAEEEMEKAVLQELEQAVVATISIGTAMNNTKYIFF